MSVKITKTKRVSAALQVVESITNSIKEGKLKVDDQLPNEQELALLLGVGRSSLREGVQILVANGVLEVRQGDGTYVTDKFAEKVFEYLGFSATSKDFLYLLELRRVLECGCICSICGKLSKDELKDLERLAQAIDADVSTEANIEYDITFHEMLFLSTDNYLIYQFYRMMGQALHDLMHEMMKHADVAVDARDSHIKIVNGLKNNDTMAAVSAMSEHLDRIRRHLKDYYQA
jgi:Transcriptional regulators